jgi:membrane protein DedA with SNARE-associated domain
MTLSLERAPYLAIYVAAMIEGEAVFAIASVLVAAGKLSAPAVLICGALGAATGDQFYYYLFRGTLRRWLRDTRRPRLLQSARLDRLREMVERNQDLAAFIIRFTPGLRVAIAAMCGWAKGSPLRFSLINLAGAFVWAGVLLAAIAWLGPSAIHVVGIDKKWTAVAVAVLILALIWRASRLAPSSTDG